MSRKPTDSRIFSFYMPNVVREKIQDATHMSVSEFVRQAIYEKLAREYKHEWMRNESDN